MKRLLNKFFLTLSVLFATALPVAMPSLAYAATGDSAAAKNAVCEGLGSGGCNSSAPNINGILKTVLNIFSAVVGFIAVIMIIVGGLKYIMSQGESSNVNGAKNTILYAVVGLVVVAVAQIIVKFVLTKVTA